MMEIKEQKEEIMTVNKFWQIDMNYFESFYQITIQYSKIYSNEIIDFVIQS